MIKRILGTEINKGAADFSLLIFRVAIGAMMLTHGWAKFMKLLEGKMKFTDPIGLGEETSFLLTVFAEFACSILIIVGFGTRISAFLCAFTMGVAAFIVHAGDEFGTKEKAFLYLSAYILLMFLGAGRYSMDKRFD